MPGLRVFRSLRPPFVATGRHRTVAREDPARCAADADRGPARARRALRRDPFARRGRLIGVVLAALLRIPHLYDMHSSLPQQLTNFAFSRSRIIRRVFLAIERADDPPVARRHRHLSVARGDGARDRSAGADRADRERARIGGGRGDGRAGRRRPAQRLA